MCSPAGRQIITFQFIETTLRRSPARASIAGPGKAAAPLRHPMGGAVAEQLPRLWVAARHERGAGVAADQGLDIDERAVAHHGERCLGDAGADRYRDHRAAHRRAGGAGGDVGERALSDREG